MSVKHPDREALKKGTAELLVLAQLEERPSHGYEIAQRIDARSRGARLVPRRLAVSDPLPAGTAWADRRALGREARAAAAPLLPADGAGRKVLAEQRKSWSAFMQAVQAAAGLGYA